MTIHRRALLAAAAASPLVPSLAGAQTRWQMATAYPDGNFHTRNIQTFLAELQAANIAVQLHSNAALLPMGQIKRGVQTGQVQLGEILLSAYGNEDAFFEVDGIPGLVPDFAGAKRLSDLSKPYVEARLNRQGLSLLYMVPWPPGGFYSNVPLASLESLRGTKFRTFNVMTNRFASLIGASPTLVQQAELPQAFATGVVNAMVTSAQTGVDTQAWDYCRVFTPAAFTFTRNVIMVQKRVFDALPPATQAAIRAAAATAETRGWRMAEEATASTEATLRQRGMTISEATPELKEGMRRISAQMTEEWVSRTGEDGQKLIAAYRA
ncbi:TRAP transporter substrate-binding protein DctP [Roseococcus sp. SYP-B2431]|uniref:TRAP transporter substrate-binding protein n=1 Tax=Roseococcus sp. SYP-B2431 TaxID=2496640 RepID=UPI00103B98DB|nr:TRAP transporter substrate-binding protein [Roseococcus sp. SYP-B2431]TCH98599.1 TRAP transporter substrate-binding protein DctP [Roseococcus sp. SYP-B2431]